MCSSSAAISASKPSSGCCRRLANRIRLWLVDVASFAVLRVLRLEILDAGARSLGRRSGLELDVVAAAGDPLRPDGVRHDAVCACRSCCRSSFRSAGRRADDRIRNWHQLRGRDAVCDVFGHADRVRARRRRGGVHGHLHARGLARYRDPERLRGNGLDHAVVDPALHPEGRGDRQIPRRPGPVFGAACLAAPRARRARRRQRVCLRAVRGDGRIVARHLLGDRLGRHPRNAQARLFRRLRGRHHRRRRHARHPAAALDHHDPVRGRRGKIARTAVPRRHRTRPAAGHAVRHLCGDPLSQGVCRRQRALRQDRRDVGDPDPRRVHHGASASTCCRGCCRSCCC